MEIFKGLLYKNNFFYNFLDYLKNKEKRNLRFKILNNYIRKKTSLIDVCGGTGQLKIHIDKSIKYTVADASDQFESICKNKNNNINKDKDYEWGVISVKP